MPKSRIPSLCLTKPFKDWVNEISNEIHMGTTLNELCLLTCLHIPAMKELMINSVSVAVYQSTETKSHIINNNAFSINNQKKHTHNSLMTFIGSKALYPLEIMVVFFLQPPTLKAHLFPFSLKT